jgi:Arc/MetJ family transcription regulator
MSSRRDVRRARLAISFGAVGYPRFVTKRLIEVDDEKLEAVRELLGTRTLKATVDEAFDEVLALARRRKALLEARGRDESELADSNARRETWG